MSRRKGSAFASVSTAEEMTDGIHGTSLTAIVTGATSGFSVESPRVLALRGVHIIMRVRNLLAPKDVKEGMLKEIPSAKLDYMELDLRLMSSVRKFASNCIASALSVNNLMET